MAGLSLKIINGIQSATAMRALDTGLEEESVKNLRMAGIILQKHLRLHSSGKTVGQGRGIHVGRGDLARRWQVDDAKGTPANASITVGTNHPAAAILEFGKTIVPKRAKFLTIPVSPLADRRTIRDFPDGRFVQTKRGLIYIREIEGGKGQGRSQSQILFILRKSVRMPPFRYITNAITDATPEVNRATDNAVNIAIQKAAK